nr:hypothetical protein [Streptomyces sp. TLI_235]
MPRVVGDVGLDIYQPNADAAPVDVRSLRSDRFTVGSRKAAGGQGKDHGCQHCHDDPAHWGGRLREIIGQGQATEWVSVELYVPTRAFPGMVREVVGFRVAVLIPDMPVAVCTGPGGYSGERLAFVTLAVPVTVADWLV